MIAPVSGSQRYAILDVLRGLALLGIVMANFPEFSLYSFMTESDKAAMPSAGIDFITNIFLYIFIDGKFYTIFSLLFGIGFSIIIANVKKRGGNGYAVFYRRMCILLLIGLIHLFFLWSGDILMLYALVGMLLPLFRNCSNRGLLRWALLFLILPVVVDFVVQWCNFSPSAVLIEQEWVLCNKYGITQENFAYWLRDASNYNDVFKFLLQGAVERMTEFIDGNRYFKVLGLFLIGFYIGRNKLYARLGLLEHLIKKIALMGLLGGIPLSVLYALSCIYAHPVGLGFHSVMYFLSVYLTAFGYVAVIILWYQRNRKNVLLKILCYPGRMALTNYIGQSAIGMFVFYGIFLGFGASVGLFQVEVVAVIVFVIETGVSKLWLNYLKFGPLEWIWRCFTYGKIFSLIRRK